ncbi:MAG: bifunctional metallophosphatase/5'-nucleotidase [Kofleriaceae bacterium]|jgi:5'-nucleotidase/UDP-sugar diphosphatase|nr:bifunctional metallophosphatase/5'-nucleotidase [Kofleriaceae bacterium]MBP9172714.1 bifunctional metallophosphatase/5'-nucleotidase [Kofleriaceae bacterium]MBP9862641.1 bifunctional metallophosphatase/5'-nucleotidase [Kofleriaceae bacterium]
MRAARTSIAASAAALAALAAGCTVEREAPDLAGQDIRLTFIHTSDIHSRLFPYEFVPNRFERDYGLVLANSPFGGVAQISTLTQQIRATSRRSLWLDSGDCFQGAPVFNLFKGEAEMRALSEAGMDAAVIGNHEFDLGAVNLYEQVANWARFPLLASNYLFEDPINPDAPTLKDVIAPYAVFDLDGVKVGVIGMANWSSMTGIFEGGNSLGIRPITDRQAVEQYVSLLRPSVDLVVLVSHLGLDEDEGLTAADVVDENEALPLEGVDLILGGHLHIVTNPPKIIPSGDGLHNTVLVHSGAFAKFVGRLDVVVRIGEDNGDPTKRSRITSFAYDNLPVDSRVPADPKVAHVLEPYAETIARDIDLDGVFAFVNTSGDAKITRNDLTGGDSQLGNLVARAMQTFSGVEAEFALTNSLGIRADFEQGRLTNEAMFNVFPFENSITVMYLSGIEIQETLDFVAQKSSERGCRTQAQVSGIWFDMVCRSTTCPDRDPDDDFVPSACAKNIWLGENCRGGNPDGPIDPAAGCRPVVPTGLYRVAVNDYISRGGSGFTVLKRNTSKQDTGIALRDALTVYLRNQTQCAADAIDTVTDPGDPKPIADRYGPVACLGDMTEAHDGRIRPVFE